MPFEAEGRSGVKVPPLSACEYPDQRSTRQAAPAKRTRNQKQDDSDRTMESEWWTVPAFYGQNNNASSD